MANLKDFIAEGSRAGMELDVYAGRLIQIGEGRWITVEELRIKVWARIKLLDLVTEGHVEIIMPDLAPRGKCTVILNETSRHDNCPYHVLGNRLKIEKVRDRTLELEGWEGKWTWLGVSDVPTWIGLWPKGENLVTAARFGPADD